MQLSQRAHAREGVLEDLQRAFGVPAVGRLLAEHLLRERRAGPIATGREELHGLGLLRRRDVALVELEVTHGFDVQRERAQVRGAHGRRGRRGAPRYGDGARGVVEEPQAPRVGDVDAYVVARGRRQGLQPFQGLPRVARLAPAVERVCEAQPVLEVVGEEREQRALHLRGLVPLGRELVHERLVRQTIGARELARVVERGARFVLREVLVAEVLERARERRVRHGSIRLDRDGLLQEHPRSELVEGELAVQASRIEAHRIRVRGQRSAHRRALFAGQLAEPEPLGQLVGHRDGELAQVRERPLLPRFAERLAGRPIDDARFDPGRGARRGPSTS